MSEQQDEPSGPWDLYLSRNFADLWYGARAAGERTRALALEHLYRNRPRPDGPHPDPREPAAFSCQAILANSADLMGLRISPLLFMDQPPAPTSMLIADNGNLGGDTGDTGDDAEEGEEEVPRVWILTYHAERDGRQRPPEIGIRSLDVLHRARSLVEFEIACLIGYWHHEYPRLTDPDAPGGYILLPQESGVVSLLHQYAIALLCLDRDCPSTWECHCNDVRARFNAPPPDHEEPTGQYTLADLERESHRQRRDSEPRFPYRDNNRWTE
jgi:hypothetical protein